MVLTTPTMINSVNKTHGVAIMRNLLKKITSRLYIYLKIGLLTASLITGTVFHSQRVEAEDRYLQKHLDDVWEMDILVFLKTTGTHKPGSRNKQSRTMEGISTITRLMPYLEH